MVILQHFLYILFRSKRIFIGGMIPMAIFITILASFFLVYTNTFQIVDSVFSIKKYSLIFKTGTTIEEVDRVFQVIKKYSQIKQTQKIFPAQVRKEIAQSFDSINRELESLQLEKFPYLIEFTLEKNQGTQTLLDYLKKQPSTHVVISGLSAAKQIHVLLKIVDLLGLVFLIFFAISLFYIVNHTIQISFFYFLKEIEVYLILGASKFFIYCPFLLFGLFLCFKSFLVGFFVTYIIFLLTLSLVTFNESSFFIKDIAQFFSIELLLVSLAAFLAIGLISSFSAIYYVVKKIIF